MKTWTVTLESYEGRCKRVKILAADAYEAMAAAQMKYTGWIPVEVK